MKAIIIAVVAVIVMAVALSFRSSDTVTYIKESVTPEVVAPIVKEAWMLDEEAIQAAKDVIKKKELQVELADLKDLQASTTAKIKEVEKELGTF
jgi:hypothetical protein